MLQAFYFLFRHTLSNFVTLLFNGGVRRLLENLGRVNLIDFCDNGSFSFLLLPMRYEETLGSMDTATWAAV